MTTSKLYVQDVTLRDGMHAIRHRYTLKQVEEIANQKMVDLNANDLDAACKIIAGTARSMGIEVG